MRLILVTLLTLTTLGACETVPGETQASSALEAPILANDVTGAGIYFPTATSFEQPEIRFPTMPGVGPQQRQLFVDQLNVAAISPGLSMPAAVMAVGDGRKTLVFMHLGETGPTTPYMARAVLARLTSITRLSPEIANMGLSNQFDIYNMAAVLGFERIIVSNGRDFAHEATLKPEL